MLGIHRLQIGGGRLFMHLHANGRIIKQGVGTYTEMGVCLEHYGSCMGLLRNWVIPFFPLNPVT